MKIYMRTPISYYGGKQQMLRHILPIIPQHETYVEPFFGGGAVFWAKRPAQQEIINDLNAHVINFYKQVKSNFNILQKLIKHTLHSRDQYKEAMIIYHAPYLFDEVRRAWAFWVTTNMGFTRQIGSWGYDRSGKMARYIYNKKTSFCIEYADRLETVTIESNDAVKVIKSRDAANVFYYADPPYVDADQGHYGGYSQDHFSELLSALCNIKGKFLLSSYPNYELNEKIKEYGWYSKTIEMHLSASSKSGRKKTEVLTANYPI